jgi:hypothetical protein
MFGSFSIKVLMQGVLSLLDHGTLGSNSFVPKHYMDGNIIADIVAETTKIGEIANFIKPELVEKSGMFTGMMQSFIDIANDQEIRDGDGITPFIQKYFSTEDNSVCANILAGIGSDVAAGSLDPAKAVEDNQLFQASSSAESPSGAGLVFKAFNDKNITDEEFISGIVENLNNAQRDNGPYDSFLSRILGYGQQLMFSTVETPYAIWTVPFVPYFNSADAYTINADTISQVDWRLNPNTMLEMYQGAVLTPGIGAFLANSQTDSDVIAGFRLPITGRVLTIPIPSVLCSIGNDIVMDNNEDGAAVQAREVVSNLPTQAATDLAMLYTYKGNFDNRMISVSSPFLRMDIAPLTPVKVNMPGSLDLQRALESSSLYGYVDQVVISMSAGERPRSSTTYVVKACRSYTQQKSLVDPFVSSGFHPLFTHNWKGSRLDNRSHR